MSLSLKLKKEIGAELMNGTWIAIFLVIQCINILLTLVCLAGLGELGQELKDLNRKIRLYWEGDGK